ncbi:MAG: DUF2147 domain-containing protein [Bacteroidales bacterium]|nr:DUF2147 domain-containing protein [Bacteroidales bacterium]
MRKALFLSLVAALVSFAAPAQSALNDNPDTILGTFLVPDPGNDSHVTFTKNEKGGYDCRIVWMENAIDPSTGKPWLDVKNPDKSLRTRTCMGLALIENIKYDSAKKQWSGAKVYDPNRGINANATIKFTEDGRLCLKGTILGIGETVYWIRQ